MSARIYLASQSPRRRELLQQIGVFFDPLPFRGVARQDAEILEDALPGEAPDDYVRRVALAKADHGARLAQLRRLEAQPVLAADTTLDLDGEIIGKPVDAADAAVILARLSGRSHRVLTAVALHWQGKTECVVSASDVRFRVLEAAEIGRYVASGEPLDKAGAYALQGRAAIFAAEVSGSPSGVVGLPLCETALLLRRAGYPI